MSKRLKIADLKFDPQNARVRTAKGEAMIQKSLQEVGAARSIVIDEDGITLAGNGTVEAAGQVGIENVVIVEASGDEIIAVRRVGLTDEQKKKLAYYDNRTGDEAEWDMEQVARDLLGGYDFLDELFDDIQVPEPEKEGTDELPEDPAEVLREKWGVEYGDLWQIGPHRILCGDSTKKEDVDRLMDGNHVDICFTSPPYALGKSASLSGNKSASARGNAYKSHDDNSSDWANLMSQWVRVAYAACDNLIVNVQLLAGNKSDLVAWLAENKDNLVDIAIWDKGHAAPQMAKGVMTSTYEMIVFMSSKNASRTIPYSTWRGSVSNVYNGPPQRSNDFAGSHAATMPEHLPRWILSTVCDSAKTIMDPFAGTGTTMVAAHNEGRTCYAMEIDPAYVAVCIERMAQLGYDPDKVEKVKG